MVRFLFYGRDHHECVCDNSTGHTHRSHRLDRHRNACRDRHQCHEKKNRTIMLGATNIPLLNADIVTGISMMLLFVKFMNLGFVTVLIAHITFDVPYVILNVLPKLNQTNRYTYEAALDLGATPMYAFYKVTWPEIKSGVFSGFLMAVTMSLDDFSITFFTKGARRQHPVDDALHRAAQGGAPGIVRPVNHFVCISSASCHEPPFGQNRRESCRYPLKEVPEKQKSLNAKSKL